jgi:hypothetical protein
MRVLGPSKIPALAVLLVCLAVPAAILYAGRLERRDQPGGDPLELALGQAEFARAGRLQLPPLTPPPQEFAPFGRPLAPRRVRPESAPGLLATNLGMVPWDPDKDDLRSTIPAPLRYGPGEVESSARGTLHPGLNDVLLDEAAMRERGADALLASLAEHATILGSLPGGALLVQVRPEELHALRGLPGIARTRAFEPYMKIDPALGTLPRLSPHEAANPALHATVTIVPGLDGEETRRRIEAIPGVSEVVAYASEGSGYELRIDYRSLAALARLDEVMAIGPVLDYALANAEIVPTVQAGSAQDASFERPFDRAGVDGGGIDTNGDGMRINNGTDAVPPQIVTITDNGISYDTPSFSQTGTETSKLLFPIGPSHRKIHAIQNVIDSGTSCDAPLSGGGTHGQIVASVIAAYPSQFGVYATRSGIGGPTEPRSANLDGVARGARIIMQDAGNAAQCTINSLVERGGNVSPGSLLDRLNAAIAGGGTAAHLAVFPFGAPDNFSTIPNPNNSNGTYPQTAVDVDTFLYNNRDFMVFVPVGNNGGLIGSGRLGLALRVIPDFFDGTDQDDDPNSPAPIQVSPPATAKNIVSVGGTTSDCFTFFGGTDCESTIVGYTSRGPATPQSLRMAPIVTAPQFDLIGTPYTAAVAVFRSNDNDNLPPIEAVLDEGNFGTSYAAAAMTGAGALIRDYFAQGFYPTGDRQTSDRVANVSGALVKAALAASSDFNEGGIGTQGQDNNERNLRRTRAMDMGSINLVNIRIMGNSEQGYGRPVLTDVLPLAGWSDDFVLHPDFPNVREYPAAGLLVFDPLATGEGLIDNTTATSRTHTFRVAGPHTIVRSNGGVALMASQLRIALAWPDRPSPAASGGPLVNDLDLVVESPGPDNCLTPSDPKPDGSPCPATAANDNEFYDGNNYDGGHNNAVTDQWSKVRLAGGAELHDARNPIEAIHLTGDPNNDGSFADSPLYAGTWRVTVKRGLGGAIPGQITITVPTTAQDADQNEDDNNNGRLDAGEDNNGNGLLDQPGQPYALVVSGPVLLAETVPAAGPASYPSSTITWDRVRYSCADNAVLSILDTSGAASASKSQANTVHQVVNAAGVVIDSETGFSFAAPGDPFVTRSAGLPVRLAAPAIPNNGILEGDTGSTLVATYAPAGQRAVTARAPMSCDPDLVTAYFTTAGGNAIGQQVSISGGCDGDDFLDAGETVTYGVALQNRSRTDDYGDVVATLTPSGPGAAAVQVLDSPQALGRFAGSAQNAVFFHVRVNAAAANALAVANRMVDMTLNLDAISRGARLSRQSYTFHHAINSDREAFFYSTDHITGGREVRDLNRNGVIDPADTIDPVLGFVLPREDVTFSSLFSGSGAPAGHFTNELGEDLDLSGVFNGSERNVVPNVDGSGTPILDHGILNSNNPADPAHRVPWSFDNNGGGWIPFRHPGSTAANVNVNPVWEYKTTGGLCGFQTSGGFNKFGVWHTGDGDPTTPSGVATACDKHAQPFDTNTPGKTEMLFDVLTSPLVAKVNQVADARGFPYTVEFQRFGMNMTIQIFDGYAGGGVNIDNNADSDNENSLLGQQVDQYYSRRAGGWPIGLFRFAGEYFNGPGIDPTTTAPHQRTFGPFLNPNGSETLDGDECCFSGTTPPGTNPASSSPIPPAPPDYLPYPVHFVPLVGICDGGAQAGQPCDPQVPGGACVAGGGVCTAEVNTIAGPVRNFDSALVGYEGGFASMINASAPENFFFHVPGTAGNRWLLGIGFWAIESPTHSTDFGVAMDDVVFEWKEYHPQDEAVLGKPAACSRFGGVGNPAGGQCATLAVDRSTLYECDEAVTVTVFDAKCVALGAGASMPLGGACTADATCGTGGVCSGARPSIQVAVATDSDGIPIAGGSGLAPGAKRYTLAAVPGTPGFYRGTVAFSSLVNDASHVFVSPGSDGTFSVYYFDPLCDGDRDGQAGEDDFGNLDGDGIADAADNCPGLYNPAQEDADGDGFGDLCDDCPAVANPTQDDTDMDGVGDACEFEDIDGDGVPNEFDNCRDVRNGTQPDLDNDGRGDLCDTLLTAGVTFGPAICASGTCSAGAVGRACTTNVQCIQDCNTATHLCSNTAPFTSPTPTAGQACSVDGDCFVDLDRDGDGVLDRDDNCVLAANGPLSGPNNQTDSDHDGLGDVCDGDCAGAVQVFRCRANGATCSVPESNQPTECANSFGLGVVCGYYVQNAGACSTANDDADADGVADAADDCPTVSNPPIVAGRPAQPDRDRDGLGDACDPAGAFDDAGDAIPDDVVVFNGTIACRTRPLASFAILALAYQDLDGDHDPYPDTGETGRVTFTLRNLGPALTGVVFTMSSADPNVACITSPSVTVASFPAGATLTVGSLDPGQPGFTFTASNSLQSPPSPAPPAQVVLYLRVVANEADGLMAPTATSLIADINTSGPQTFVVGPDGVAGTTDDGEIVEAFDRDADGDGLFTIKDTFRLPIAPGVYRGTCSNAPMTYCQSAVDCPAGSPAPICQSGVYLRGSDTGAELNRLAAVTCGGYDTAATNPLCRLDPDFPMDWHLHCAPGAGNCPNTESVCVGTGCSYNTPTNGAHAHSLPNSLHMGAHFNPADALAGDTTHFRTLQGFESAPINLALLPRPGDLDLSFFQIARLMDNNGVNEVAHICLDCADVQVQRDLDPDPQIDSWGFWEKLVPYQNVYDHKPTAFSIFGSYYCLFTPTDTGTTPPAPHGVTETLCWPQGAWSHCGSTISTNTANVVNCTGPGELDAYGTGVWAQTKFNLAALRGQRIRIRWIAESWNFGAGAESYYELGNGWNNSQQDDGWWLDDIVVTGAVQQQFTPVPDTTPRTGSCPTDACNEGVGDAGTAPAIEVRDLNGSLVDGATLVPSRGQTLRLSGSGSTFPGGCSNGAAEYRFERNGVVAQDWSTSPVFLDAPEATTHYRLLVRCSADHACTSVAGAVRDVGVLSGEGGEIALGAWGSPFDPSTGVTYDRVAHTTTIRWWSPGTAASDLYRGRLGPGISRGTLESPFWRLATSGAVGSEAACLLNGVAGTPETAPPSGPGGTRGSSGALTQAVDADPAPGFGTYYLVASGGGSSGTNALGCAAPGVCNHAGWCDLGTKAGAPCNVAADCPGGGTCVLQTTFCSADAGTAGQGGCGAHQVCAGGTTPGHLCSTVLDCPGSGASCPVLAAGVKTTGSSCLTVGGTPPATPGAAVGECPPPGSPLRTVRLAPAANVCP